MQHACHLPRHQAAGFGVAVQHGSPQRAEGKLFQLHFIGPGLFARKISTGHFIF
ncbi:hypothetical protein SDC9_106939 [bioreactor metagenome]|uniref:Uncharacterized protein n=1 Tax=bioreactor metagenome TaxID=1076179 RepID=A0A645B3S3_9ZZZZ